MSRIEWVDELPGRPPEPRRGFYTPRGDSQDLHDHAAALVKHPMRWAKYPRKVSVRQAYSITNALQEGVIAAYSPQLGFEAVRRGADIYVRHNPECVSPSQLAFFDGYRAGVRRTIETIRTEITNLRTLMAKLERENNTMSYRPEVASLLGEGTAS